MARKKTQQEENVNEVEQVVVDTNDKEDPWDGYYSGTLMSGESEVLNSEPGIIDDGGTIDTSATQNPVSEYNTMDVEQPNQQQQQASGMQINMNDITRAAFVQLRQAAAYPDKEVDDFTIKEFKKANAHLKNVIRTQMAGDKFDLTASYTSLLCLLAMAHINEVDLNEYFKVNV